ncbi:MAG: fascin domain-containing protein [Nannocystales bacterium]
MNRFGSPFLAALLLVAAPFANAAAQTQDVRARSTAVSMEDLAVELASLPIALHRRAADTLELERERSESPWADAQLSTHVIPMFRPGETHPTHYEVGVLGPYGEARGFMVLSSGEHDYPVVLSTATGPRRTAELAAAMPPGERPSRVYFLSPVSMVAEAADGHMLANLGGLPPKVEHAQMAWLDAATSTRQGHTHHDAQTGQTLVQQPEHRIELGTWASWSELREGYADNMAVLHEVLRRGARDDWAADDDFRTSGEGLQSGWFREVPLLSRGDAQLEVSGPGASFVRTQIDERPYEGDNALRVFVEDIPGDDVHPLDVTIRYGDGSSEVHRFDVTRTINLSGEADPDGAPPALPHGALAAPSATAAPECRKAVLRSNWDTYVYARDGGGSTLEARGGWVGGWEVFKIHRVGAHNVQLQASNGEWVYASGTTVRADGLNAGGDAVFQRRTFRDGRVAFRARNRRYLRANRFGEINAKARRATNNEKFQLKYCEPSRIEGRWAGNDPIDAYRKVRKYDQVDGKLGPNTSGCASGCGATVWAMVFGWADHMAKLGDSRWSGAANLYRSNGKKNGTPAGAPEWMWNDVPGRLRSIGGSSNLLSGPANIVLEIRDLLGDWGASGCTVTGSRFTAPHIMGQATKFLHGRVSTDLTADYDGASVMTHEGKTKAKRRLEDKQVVAIGIGHFSHYPLAYGFEDARFAKWDASKRRWARVSRHQRFVVHMGWGHPGSTNVPYDTWFQGWIDPPQVVSQSSNEANDSASAPVAPLPRANKPLNPQQNLPGNLPPPTFPH